MAQTQYKTGKGPCPATGHTGNWSYIGSLHNPSFIISYCGGTALSGWIAVGEASTGGAMFKPDQTKQRDRSDEITLDRWLPPTATPDEATGKAPSHILHQVYELTLQHCPLTDDHKATHLKRGIPIKALNKRLRLGSLPAPQKRPEIAQKIYESSGLTRDQILQVPGFFINQKGHLSLAGRQGLLLGTTDAKGRIIGFQIRCDRRDPPKSDLRDHQRPRQRYTWLSAGHKPGGTGSGAPASFLGDRSAEIVALTEGAFKIAALDYFGLATASISIAGVGNIKAALERLDELPNLKELHIYYDADWSQKKQVLKALIKMLKASQQRGLQVRVWGWPPSWGKGIDDALTTGMPKEALFELPLDGLLRCTCPFKSHPRLKTDTMPTWNAPQGPLPDMAFFRQQTLERLTTAFAMPVGTFVSIGAPTNTGKTYCTNRHVPAWNIRVFRDYTALEESEVELLQLYGQEKVGVLYGRIAPPKNQRDEAARERYAKAGCPNHAYMKERAEKGQWACSGCPLAPDHKEPGKETCAYWRHRKALFANPPEHLLAVQQAATHNRELCEHLPRDRNQELFEQKYTSMVIDDCPQFGAQLSHEKAITPQDVEVWRKHPELEPTDPEQQNLLAWLNVLQQLLQDEQDPKIFERLRNLSKTLCQNESFICEEEAYEYELPRRAIKSLSTWLARGGPIRFEEPKARPPKEGQEAKTKGKTLFYLDPPHQLLERLKHMRLIHLDATPDETRLRWLADSLGMSFEAPDFVRRTPKIIQVADLLWSREQLSENKELVKALIHHIQEQGGVALGFKELDDPELTALFDGHWGRDERGLNVFKGAKGVGLFGHYALPVEEARKMAHRQRALAWHLGTASPEPELAEALQEERIFSDPWRPWVRTMHCEEDPLVEHIRRYHHTSSVVQGGDRDRATETTAFLLSGEPLDGLPWEIPVKVMTKRELRDFLGLSSPAEEQRKISEGLKRYNAEKQEKAKERLEALLPELRDWVRGLEESPGVRQTLRYLNDRGEKAGQAIVYRLLNRLNDELREGLLTLHQDTEQRVEQGMVLGDALPAPTDEPFEVNQKLTIPLDTQDDMVHLQGELQAIEVGVSHTALKDLKLRPLCDTPTSITPSDTEHLQSDLGSTPPNPGWDELEPKQENDIAPADALEQILGLASDALGEGESDLVFCQKRPEASCWPLHEEGLRELEQLGEPLQQKLFRIYESLLERGRSWRQASALCLSWLVSLGYQLSEEAFWSCFWWRKGLTPGLMVPWSALRE